MYGGISRSRQELCVSKLRFYLIMADAQIYSLARVVYVHLLWVTTPCWKARKS